MTLLYRPHQKCYSPPINMEDVSRTNETLTFMQAARRQGDYFLALCEGGLNSEDEVDRLFNLMAAAGSLNRLAHTYDFCRTHSDLAGTQAEAFAREELASALAAEGLTPDIVAIYTNLYGIEPQRADEVGGAK